jgi:3-oxoacyl-[acyl-carrier protein] reductase
MSSPTGARDLTGKVALVVGGSGDQGAVYAEAIAARGATVVISYEGDEQAAQRTLKALRGHGVTAEAVRSDARRSVDVDSLFDGLVDRHGHPDIVLHTPGAIIKKPLVEFTDTALRTGSAHHGTSNP